MTHASLFSGIGGFDLAAEWMGWANVFNCEWEEFPRRVLKHHFPNTEQYGDIKELDATTYAGRIDILTGGFPCQPYSTAGKRKGKDDERHLWPEMLRVIRECTPRYVVGENVRGLIGWNGGMVYEEVCSDLEACGYAVQPFLLPACGVGAPHRRDRIWFVAYSDKHGTVRTSRRYESESREERIQERHEVQQPNESDSFRDAPDTNSLGRGRRRREKNTERKGNNGQGLFGKAERPSTGTDAPDTKRLRLEHGTESRSPCESQDEIREHFTRHFAPESWTRFPTVPPICGRDDGLSKELDGITFSKWRRESIKAYGNAIVPQVALQIFKAIEQYEREILV